MNQSLKGSQTSLAGFQDSVVLSDSKERDQRIKGPAAISCDVSNQKQPSRAQPARSPAGTSKGKGRTTTEQTNKQNDPIGSSSFPAPNSSYLTSAELDQLKPNEKLILDLYPLLRKHANIYTIAIVLREAIKHSQMMDSIHGREVSKKFYRQSIKFCLAANPEQLYHRMNTGQDGALLEWQRFSMSCLNMAIAQHIIHNKPLPIKLDSDLSLPAAKRAAHDRARIKLVTTEMSSYWQDVDASSDACHFITEEGPGGRLVTRRAKPATFPYRFLPDELGPDEDFILDASGAVSVPHSLKVVHVLTSRTSMLTIFDHLSQLKMTEADLMVHQAWYAKLRKHCIEMEDSKVRRDFDSFGQDCLLLAIYERLLHGTPLCIKSLDIRDSQFPYDCYEDSSAPKPDSKPAQSPLGNIGGYELHCTLKEGGPEHVIHLPLEAFKDEDVVVIDLSDLLGWRVLLPMTQGSVMYMLKGVRSKATTPAELETLLRREIQLAKRVNPAVLDHIQSGSEQARKQFETLALTGTCIACAQQLGCNQPIKLSCYPGMEIHDGCQNEVQKFMKRAREECIKVLTSKGIPFEL